MQFVNVKSRTSVVARSSGGKVDIRKQGLNSIKNKTVQNNLMGVSDSMKDSNWVDASGRKRAYPILLILDRGQPTTESDAFHCCQKRATCVFEVSALNRAACSDFVVRPYLTWCISCHNRSPAARMLCAHQVATMIH
jgi:hypothetical protein